MCSPQAMQSCSLAMRSDFWSTLSRSRATRCRSRGLVWGSDSRKNVPYLGPNAPLSPRAPAPIPTRPPVPFLPLLSLSALCVSVLKSNLPVLPGGLHHYCSPAQNLSAPGRLVGRLTVAGAIRSVFPKLPWSRPLPRRKGFQRDQVNGCCDRLRCGCQRRLQQAVRIRGGPSCCASARTSTGGSGRRGVFSIARCAAAACFAGDRCCGHV